MKKNNVIISVLFLILIVFTFPFLFSNRITSAGDYTQPTATVISFVSNFWSWCDYTGLGFNCAAINLHATPMWYIALLLQAFGLPTFLIERVLWWIPFFIGGFMSILLLSKKIFPENKFWYLSPFIFLFNTYILMVVGGGQIQGIALGYALTPLLLWSFVRALEKVNSKRVVIVGLLLALQVVIDPRIAFIGYFGCFFYTLLRVLWEKNFSWKNLGIHALVVFVPPLIATGLHAYWIVPSLIVHQNPLVELGPAYSTTGAAQYFSFASFENALGLLHPNWPENLFGLTHFMRPEFIILPLLAFGSLFFVHKKEKSSFSIIFLALLALIGVFLAKGAQDPFGNFYLWIFSHVPGFQLFRDPTKWYLLIALSFSLLIPYSLEKYSQFLQIKFSQLIKQSMGYVIVALFALFYAWTILPLFSYQLTGVFISSQEPKEYKQLDSFLSSQPGFFRTLWVPTTQRFGLYSVNHPTIGLNIILPKLNNISDLGRYETLLQEMGIRYVIIPYDSVGEIYVTDRKYDEKQYIKTLQEVQKISWLVKDKAFGKLIVFKVPDAKDKFFILGKDSTISYVEKNPTDYRVTIHNSQKDDKLVFADTYDSHWIVNINNKKMQSEPYDRLFNSFAMPRNGDLKMKIYYFPQQYVWLGIAISALALSATIVLLFRVR